MNILVTGANGFVGSTLCTLLETKGIDFISAVRHAKQSNQRSVGDISATTKWDSHFQGSDTVIHLAARVHVMDEQSNNPLAAFRAMNVDATVNLALQAARCGVKRFVFVSSIKVNGEESLDRSFTAFDDPSPQDPYAISKMEAEQALRSISQSTGMELVIVRPPLVYGAGVQANFLRLMQLARQRVPLPFASIDNRRSMVALDNLVDLLLVCAQHPAAAGQTFLVSDDQDVNISELVKMLAQAMGRRSYQFPLSKKIIYDIAKILGKSAMAHRLLGSLQIDIQHTKTTLNWTPVVNLQQAVNNTCTHFMAHQ